MRNLLLAAAVTLLMIGCASEPRISVATASNPNTDLAGFRTYNFMQPLGTDRPNGVRTQLSTMLMSALSREMSERGFQRSENPDLLINTFVSTEQQIDVRQVPTSSNFYGRRVRYSNWGSGNTTTQVRQFTQGTLAIDLVDASQNMLAWEGVAQQRLGSNPQQVSTEEVDRVVRAIMAEFAYISN